MKLRTFKCHICKKVVFITAKKKVKCENCGHEYTLKEGKYYRANVYSKMYKNF